MFKYPWGNLQGLNLAWFLEKFNQLLEDWATAEAGIDGALDDEIQKAEDALSDVFDARDAAAASATAAAGSATQAGTSATAAQNSATAAASSATLANNKATAAGLSEANAAQSASQAAGSATTASNAATTASGAATAAGNSATAAAGSASNAANSASDAANSATAAAASAAAAEAVEESIPEDYTALSNEVNDLAAAFSQKMLTPFEAFANVRLQSFTFSRSNRKVTIEKNHLTIEHLGNSSSAIAASLFTGDDFSIPANESTNHIYPIECYRPISEIISESSPAIQLTASLEYSAYQSGVNGIIIQFVSIDENETITYTGHTGLGQIETMPKYRSAHYKPADNATHYGIFYISRRQYEGALSDMVFQFEPVPRDFTALALSN